MPAVEPVDVGGRAVGPDRPVLVIAEAGVNHDGDLGAALELVDAAAAAGADAVKFQTFSADRVAVPGAPKAAYQERSAADADQYAMLRRLELAPEAFGELAARAREHGILFLSTAADPADADVVEAAGSPAFKVGSGEVTNWPLLADLAARGRPLLLSTGMASLAEVAGAVECVRGAGDPPLVLLHCVSAYPADPAESNLRAIPALEAAFGVPVGWSDHTPGHETAVAAVALGACVLEKHLTLDTGREGPDHAASLDPAGFADYVRRVRLAEAALGDGVKRPAASEHAMRAVVRRGLVLAANVPGGSPLAPEHLVALRPAEGLPPTLAARLVGRIAARDLTAGERLGWGDVR